MASSTVPKVWRATAKPILSSTFQEARRRALNLYRAWYREVSIVWICVQRNSINLPVLQIPRTVEIYALDMPVKRGREKLREQFYKNANVRDPRVIDMLVVKVCVNVVCRAVVN